MVLTRSNRAQLGIHAEDNDRAILHTSPPSPTSSQSSHHRTYSFDHGYDDDASDNQSMHNRDNDMYSPNDHCHRHRRPDNADYGVQVTSYRRRAPARNN